MKAYVLTGIRTMEAVDAPMPDAAGSNDVLLKVEKVGVCGSDVHYYTTGRIGSQVVQYPYRVGHEFSATVVKAGASVESVHPGDRVAVEPAISCWECDQCRAGRPHTCRNLKFLGCPGQAEGCLAEYIVMPSECCFSIPGSMTLEEAALVEPLSIGIYAVRLAGSMRDKDVAILGAGPIGLSVLTALRSSGVLSVSVTDRINARLAAAGAHGADWTGNPDEMDVVRGIAEKRSGMLDCVFECCGKQEAIDQAIDLLKPGGKLLLIGIPEVDRVSFSIDLLRRKEISVQNVRRQNHCMKAAVDLLASNPGVCDYMITHRFQHACSGKAFDLVEAYGDGVIKAMISF